MQDIMPFISKHSILVLAWVGLLVAVIVLTVKSSLSKVKEVVRGEAIQLINKEDAIVVDIRNRDDYRRGHIANAINLIPNDIKSGNLGELEKHKSQPIIVVCANGLSSRESAENLLKAGFVRAMTLKDGLTGWSGENLPLVRGKQ
ncbi:rhodanese-like domain-containing protein [Pectobacteriaceae bacterium CE70]|uniref:Rhodanese-like domain-containing protein n=1 Tax=Serratia sp. (strain ATCC 39006) TaxID=104623 RepID=A0A2I5T286_SERS3|nr:MULTISPECIES: rhodanese-like domain-containing protein [Enterobacterales]WJV58353.1 rhodanese-like domain-containing protein [Pectobacteriaceae bacterium C111]WJV62651.1 rhodanese-like domain-containing protein [Pectobacteriaceae bacterium C52]WJV66976.1 rhodanese-like domain-containing protein [Pectobacteriaceae bacterium CE70]WJY10965.1 rhodanese-like domain-containing protein [Pectobacteriaceae bacterium C80]WJY15002.1 rhodanese-like domain-containing protein [Pectobacteriaceae bacterium